MDPGGQESPFILVGRGGRPAAAQSDAPSGNCNHPQSARPSRPRNPRYHGCKWKQKTVQDHCREIESRKAEITESAFFKYLKDILFTHCSNVQDIVAYGIGSFTDSWTSSSILQVALLLLLQDELAIQKDSVYAYDPEFSQLDRDTLSQYGIHVLTQNDQGSRHVGRPTLFYMPHCEMWLYSNVLFSNWNSLANVFVMGNSFAEYHLKTLSDDQWKSMGPYVRKTMGLAHEVYNDLRFITKRHLVHEEDSLQRTHRMLQASHDLGQAQPHDHFTTYSTVSNQRASLSPCNAVSKLPQTHHHHHYHHHQDHLPVVENNHRAQSPLQLEEQDTDQPYAKITSDTFIYTIYTIACTFGRKIEGGTVDIPWSESKSISRHLGRIHYKHTSNSWEVLCEGKGGIIVDDCILGKPDDNGGIHYSAELHHDSQITIGGVTATFEICNTQVGLDVDDEELDAEQSLPQTHCQRYDNTDNHRNRNPTPNHDSPHAYPPSPYQLQHYNHHDQWLSKDEFIDNSPYLDSASPASPCGDAYASTINHQHRGLDGSGDSENEASRARDGCISKGMVEIKTEPRNGGILGSSSSTAPGKRKKKRSTKEPKRSKLPGQPNLSYASMICQALMSVPGGRMTLNEIYSFISITYPCFEKGIGGWQNSVRHNLSLNKAFTRVARTDGKKGSCWTIAPGTEHLFDGFRYVGGLMSRAESAAKRKSSGESTTQSCKIKKVKKELTATQSSTFANQSEYESSEESTPHGDEYSLSPPPDDTLGASDLMCNSHGLNYVSADTTLPSNLDGNGPVFLEDASSHLEISTPYRQPNAIHIHSDNSPHGSEAQSHYQTHDHVVCSDAGSNGVSTPISLPIPNLTSGMSAPTLATIEDISTIPLTSTFSFIPSHPLYLPYNPYVNATMGPGGVADLVAPAANGYGHTHPEMIPSPSAAADFFNNLALSARHFFNTFAPPAKDSGLESDYHDGGDAEVAKEDDLDSVGCGPDVGPYGKGMADEVVDVMRWHDHASRMRSYAAFDQSGDALGYGDE
ncbi:hypothetical protein SeLEV6574_g06915 [Synchytrium endobioticum]|uniref:Fork-head domain-containing protein n=2 Tax=Synchytrium endobioticum TaxID=286115 RepID=A0A507CJW9_9FUNG|nr:hypothetical protein SeLEV6574_g06915 [Synchytrium endobioticum]